MAFQHGFRYETLLRIRQRQEELQAQRLAVARRKVQAAQQQRAALSREQQEAMHRAGELARDRFDARDIRRYCQYERHLARLGDEKDSEIIALESAAEEERLELEEASKKKKMIERLKEHKLAAQAKALRIVEQKIADELAVVHRSVSGASRAQDYLEEGSH